MFAKSAIFVFTKDRPETLNKTLNSIQHTPYRKYVIDDSVRQPNQKAVLQLCNDSLNCIYLGKEEFHQFITKYGIDLQKFDFLLRLIGNTEWNLGYARNFALLYSKSLGLEKVLFTDDDIQVPNLNLIEELFLSKNDYQFVGAHILGLVDDSVLGHIATDVGIMNERMLSGGFMVFNPFEIDHFFFNNYNEDWIWLFLQLKEKKYLQTGEVFQALSNPLENYKNKIVFQEFGEIILDGILDLYPDGLFENLLSLDFWQRILIERNEYLFNLEERAIAIKNQDYLKIIQYVNSNSINFKAIIFANLFEKYFSNRSVFNTLFNSLN